MDAVKTIKGWAYVKTVYNQSDLGHKAYSYSKYIYFSFSVMYSVIKERTITSSDGNRNLDFGI